MKLKIERLSETNEKQFFFIKMMRSPQLVPVGCKHSTELLNVPHRILYTIMNEIVDSVARFLRRSSIPILGTAESCSTDIHTHANLLGTSVRAIRYQPTTSRQTAPLLFSPNIALINHLYLVNEYLCEYWRTSHTTIMISTTMIKN